MTSWIKELRKPSTLFSIIWAPWAVFLIHILAGACGVYYFFPWFDVPAHFFGGLSIALAVGALWHLLVKTGNLTKIPSAVVGLSIVAFVMAVAVMWEWAEFLGDLYFYTHMQQGIPDTMADLFLGMVGGIVGAFIVLARSVRGTK